MARSSVNIRVAPIELIYPKIPSSRNSPLARCVAFEKLDGTNLHWVWDPELSWTAFGTRRDQFVLDDVGIAEFTAAHPELNEAPEVFLGSLANPLEKIFNGAGELAEVKVFTEFLGQNSFAGRHRKDDQKQLVLFDVATSLGMLAPETFISQFSELKIPPIVYRGKLTGQFIQDVRDGRYAVAEGVVCKGVQGGCVWMAKIKTDAYQQRLMNAFSEDWERYWE